MKKLHLYLALGLFTMQSLQAQGTFRVLASKGDVYVIQGSSKSKAQAGNELKVTGTSIEVSANA